MKSQKFKRVIVVLLVTAMAVAVPSSFAKYATRQSYTMKLTKHQSWQYNTYQYSETKRELQGWSYVNVTYQYLSNETVTLPYAGRYAIIAKGGDGAKGLAWASTAQTHNYDVDGGKGGTVVGVYTTTKENQHLYVAPGFAGTNQTKGSSGAGGTNDLEKFSGGAGGKFTVAFGDVMAWLGSLLSAEPAGGGGGAATVVYQCDDNGKYSDADLLMIAGGGGGSPSWNQGYQNTNIGALGINTSSRTVPPGQGGMGGSNFGDNSTNRRESLGNTDTYVVSTALNAYCIVSYDIYDGLSGTGSNDTYDHFGTGGNIKGGLAGKAIASCAMGNQKLVDASSVATAGSVFTSGGTGGKGDYYAGGGGGGYCGGGGGNGTSIDRPAGGGGGGSSYVSFLINQDSGINYSAYISEAAAKTEKPIPSQDHPGILGANEGNGYVIIKYLGPAEDVENPNIITLDDILGKVNLICKSYPNKKNIGNTSTSDSLYKALIADSDVNLLLSGRAWRVNTDANGLSTLEFTNTKSASIGYNAKFWKYNSNGTWQTGTASYTYPSKYSSSATGFVLN